MTTVAGDGVGEADGGEAVAEGVGPVVTLGKLPVSEDEQAAAKPRTNTASVPERAIREIGRVAAPW